MNWKRVNRNNMLGGCPLSRCPIYAFEPFVRGVVGTHTVRAGKGKGVSRVIPIGLNTLFIKHADIKRTKNGGKMLHARLWKKPEEHSYGMIDCYHIIGRGLRNFNVSWYKRFTVGMSEAQASLIINNKGKPFKALTGYITRNYKGYEYIESYVHSVYDMGARDEDIKHNKFKLFIDKE